MAAPLNHLRKLNLYIYPSGLPWWLSSKESICNAIDTGSIPGSGRFPLEKEMATHFSIFTWEIPWTEEPGGVPRVKHYLMTKLSPVPSIYLSVCLSIYLSVSICIYTGFGWWLRRWTICLQCRRPRFDAWVVNIPWGGHGNPLQYSCLENPWTEEPGALQSMNV